MIDLSVGATIKKLRLEKGLTQEELGELLGVKKAAIQKYESGHVQNLKQSTIRRLCEIFDKTPSYFVYDDYESSLEHLLRSQVGMIELFQRAYGKDFIELVEIYLELSDRNKAKVLEYANDISLLQSVTGKK